MVGYSPHPDPIDRVSPTMANALLSCRLRVAFQRDPSLRPLTDRARPDAALGVASHAIAESASLGHFDATPVSDLDGVLLAYWNEQIARAMESWKTTATLCPVPTPDRWPFYSVKRQRALRYARAIVVARQSGRTHRRQESRRIDVELDLSSEDPPLLGRIDLIEDADGSICLVDLKTAMPPEAAGLSTAHRNQLLLYAALYRAATGLDATDVAIQYLDGSRATAKVDWEEVDALVASVLRLREEFNRAADPAADTRWDQLAQPDSIVCLHCDFEPVCGPFLSTIAADAPPYAASVFGEATDVHLDGDTVDVRVAANQPALGELQILGIPVAQAPTPGRDISICWATRMSNGVDLRVTWQSKLYVWPVRDASAER
jgi:RecB family exonuclease